MRNHRLPPLPPPALTVCAYCRRWSGRLDVYSDVYDRVSARAPATLGLHAERDFYYPRIMEDPVIQVRMGVRGVC